MYQTRKFWVVRILGSMSVKELFREVGLFGKLNTSCHSALKWLLQDQQFQTKFSRGQAGNIDERNRTCVRREKCSSVRVPLEMLPRLGVEGEAWAW